jgi:hypothetical protein
MHAWHTTASTAGTSLKVKQVSVRRLLVRQQQVLEADGHHNLGRHPAIANQTQPVLRRQRLEDGDGEREVEDLVVDHLPLLHEEELVVVDHFGLGILDPHPERLAGSVLTIVPLKRSRYAQRHLHTTARRRQR